MRRRWRNFQAVLAVFLSEPKIHYVGEFQASEIFLRHTRRERFKCTYLPVYLLVDLSTAAF